MATIFMDTGGGDIYGGLSREAVIAAMKNDMGEDFDEGSIEYVPSSHKIATTDENECLTGKFESLHKLFGEISDAHCVASSNQ